MQLATHDVLLLRHHWHHTSRQHLLWLMMGAGFAGASPPAGTAAYYVMHMHDPVYPGAAMTVIEVRLYPSCQSQAVCRSHHVEAPDTYPASP